MKLSKKLTTVTPLSKFIAMVLFIILPFIGFYLGIKYQEINYTITNSSQYQNQITQKQAENLIKNLPEVTNYLNEGNKDVRTFIKAENRKDNYWYVQVGSITPATEGILAHTATFNWYKVDKNTGNIICSMFYYDQNEKLIENMKQGECL